MDNYLYTSVPMGIRLKRFFAQLFLLISSVSTEQSQICVRNTVLVKPVRGDPYWQSNLTLFALANFLIVTPTPSIEIPAQENLLHKYKERVERLSQQNRVIKICTDAGFLKTVEVGKYFMTKHTNEFLHFAEPVTCREYTLPRDEKSTDPKGWIRGNTKIGPVLEVTTSYLQGKYGVEIRIESVNIDNSHSWVRISHVLNKLVTDLIDREYDNDKQETSTTKTEVFAFASRSMAKAKPRRPSIACSSSRTVPFLERTWFDIEPGAQFDQAYPVAKSLNTLLRLGEIPREEDGAIEFWRLKDDLRNKFEHSLNIGLMKCGRAEWQEAEATRKDFNAVLNRQDQKFFISELSKVIQDGIPLILYYRTMC